MNHPEFLVFQFISSFSIQTETYGYVSRKCSQKKRNYARLRGFQKMSYLKFSSFYEDDAGFLYFKTYSQRAALRLNLCFIRFSFL